MCFKHRSIDSIPSAVNSARLAKSPAKSQGDLKETR